MEQSENSKMALTSHVERKMDGETTSDPEEKKLIRRMDIRLVGTCGMLLCISLMDRTNISQGALAG
jgi:hypothetical protein